MYHILSACVQCQRGKKRGCKRHRARFEWKDGFRCDVLAVNAHVCSVSGAPVDETGKRHGIRKLLVEKLDKAMCWVRSDEEIELIKKQKNQTRCNLL